MRAILGFPKVASPTRPKALFGNANIGITRREKTGGNVDDGVPLGIINARQWPAMDISTGVQRGVTKGHWIIDTTQQIALPPLSPAS